jgi:hypothetical protein
LAFATRRSMNCLIVSTSNIASRCRRKSGRAFGRRIIGTSSNAPYRATCSVVTDMLNGRVTAPFISSGARAVSSSLQSKSGCTCRTAVAGETLRLLFYFIFKKNRPRRCSLR